MTKKPIAVLGAALIALSLFGCSAKTSASTGGKDYSNQTVTGKVTAIDGTSVTLQLGTLTSNTESSDKNTSGAEKSENSGSPTPAATAAESDSTVTASAIASTESSAPQSSDAPSGQAKNGEQSKNSKPHGGSTFKAGDETLTITVGSSATITLGRSNSAGTISDIKVGDIVEVALGNNNTVTSVKI